MAVTVKGQKELERYIKKISDADKFFEKDVKAVVKDALFLYQENSGHDESSKTNIRTSTVNRAWKVKKLGLSRYIVLNDAVTKSSMGKRYNLVRILDEGRGEIRPRRYKRLFIPLTEKGSKIPEGGDGDFGVDFVYAKRAKAVRGRKFMEKIEKLEIENLKKLMLRRIART